MAYINGKEILFAPSIGGEGGGAALAGALTTDMITEVDSIDNPTAESPTIVKYNNKIYLLLEV